MRWEKAGIVGFRKVQTRISLWSPETTKWVNILTGTYILVAIRGEDELKQEQNVSVALSQWQSWRHRFAVVFAVTLSALFHASNLGID
jgi:hypothetical protein